MIILIIINNNDKTLIIIEKNVSSNSDNKLPSILSQIKKKTIPQKIRNEKNQIKSSKNK